jgi:hypothetical protein
MSIPSDEAATLAMQISAKIKSLLAGLEPGVQSAILANLTSLWLAGHFAPTKKQTRQLRERLLADHVQLIRDLIKPSEAELLSSD